MARDCTYVGKSRDVVKLSGGECFIRELGPRWNVGIRTIAQAWASRRRKTYQLLSLSYFTSCLIVFAFPLP